jgi:outer membrane protein TolC
MCRENDTPWKRRNIFSCPVYNAILYQCDRKENHVCELNKKTSLFQSVVAFGFFVPLLVFLFSGCASAEKQRMRADLQAQQIIMEKQASSLGRTEPFSIEKPSDTLRRRLFVEQQLPFSSPISLGSMYLEPAEHLSDESVHALSFESITFSAPVPWEEGQELTVSLMEALQIGARNSRAYQEQKEQLFRAALALDLSRHEFRSILTASVETETALDIQQGDTATEVKHSGTGTVERPFKNGLTLTTQIGLDLVNLLTAGETSLGAFADATISVPLLRGSGKHIVTEPLIQAEREVVYAIYRFERYKKTFAVEIAKEYLEVLQLNDQIENTEENYRSLITARRRARRLADAGRISEIQVDQATQEELRARTRWISAQQTYERRLDSFKLLLGLPPDARLRLDQEELKRLVLSTAHIGEPEHTEDSQTQDIHSEEALPGEIPPTDAPAELSTPGGGEAGPLEIGESEAVALGMENRLDLRTALGEVYDSRRKIVVAADALRPELTLLGSAYVGNLQSVSTTESSDTGFRLNRGFYSALLSFDFALDRAEERKAYRESLIDMENAVRDFQELDDNIKLSVRNALRDLRESRENLRIQKNALSLAQKRVRSANLFLQAGLVEIRDLLEAQEALILAQNALTSALVRYRVGELELQRDMGVLEVNEQGMWREYHPEEHTDEE